MVRPQCSQASPPRRLFHHRVGYTLVEILVATTLMLIMMLAVAQIFGWMGTNINNARATLEMSQTLRAAASRLQEDLQNVTVKVDPPRRPESNEGYFEYVEGPIGPVFDLYDRQLNSNKPAIFVDSTNPNADNRDSTVIDNDDILMFTVRSGAAAFVGRMNGDTIESSTAEVAYFVRGRTLYRRVLLVAPEALSQLDQDGTGTDGNGMIDPNDLLPGLSDDPAVPPSYYKALDVSARPEAYNTGTQQTHWVPNTLGDLTKRENRFAHRVHTGAPFPYPVTLWGHMGLPVLRECSHDLWMRWALGGHPTIGFNVNFSVGRDLWLNPHSWPALDPETGALHNTTSAGNPPEFLGNRIGEDVLLTNVLGFDVKAWDPGAPVLQSETPPGVTGEAIRPGDPDYIRLLQLPGRVILSFGAYVDLNYMCRLGPLSTAPPPAQQVPDYTPPAGMPAPEFHGAGEARSRLRGLAPITAANIRHDQAPYWDAATYDTWSAHYENDGIDQDGDGLFDEGTDGFDDPLPANGEDDDLDGTIDEAGEGNNLVDEYDELEAPPPYSAPLRGIQIKIRCYEPDSRQVREITIVQDLLTK